MKSMLVCLFVFSLVSVCFGQVPNCPTEDTGVAVIYPDPTDCTYVIKFALVSLLYPLKNKTYITTIYFKFHHIISMYYMCSWGTAFRRECAPGLLFNPVLKVCDFPETAGCVSG